MPFFTLHSSLVTRHCAASPRARHSSLVTRWRSQRPRDPEAIRRGNIYYLLSTICYLLSAALCAAPAPAAADTILLVNDEYVDGARTSLGHVGYRSFDKAQAAVADKASTTIMATSADTTVEPPSFTEDIVTKDYRTRFVGVDGDRLKLSGKKVVVGDPAADVESADVSFSYVEDIGGIRFGNITGAATVSIDHLYLFNRNAGNDETNCIDLTEASLGATKITILNSYVARINLGSTQGAVTVSNTVVAFLEGDRNSSLTVMAAEYSSEGRHSLASEAPDFNGSVVVMGADGTGISLSVDGPSVVKWGKTYSVVRSYDELVLLVRPPAVSVPYFDPRPDRPHETSTNCIPYAGETDLVTGWYVVTGAVTVADRIMVEGDVNLVLADGASLTAENGIGVSTWRADGFNPSFSVFAQSTNTAAAGSLAATVLGEEYGGCAAIGGDPGTDCGAIVICGGRVSAADRKSTRLNSSHP